MESEVLISVIVPVYNAKKYLERCVTSILRQTYTNLEVILVDDGSTDGSQMLCDEFCNKDERIKVVHKKNGGISSARNAALQIAKGEYLSFIDSDDYIEAEMLETMLDLCLSKEVLLCCCGRYDSYTDDTETKIGLCPSNTEVMSSEEFVSNLFRWNGADSAACDKLFHKSLWQTLRFPEGMICEDMRVIYKACLLAGRVVLCNKAFYHYCHHEDSITTSFFSTKRLDLLQQIYDMYCYIREYYPNLLDSISYLCIKETAYIAKEIGKLEKKAFLKFRVDYKTCVYILRLSKKHWMRDRQFSKREKIMMYLHIIGLFRMSAMIYNKVKEVKERSDERK